MKFAIVALTCLVGLVHAGTYVYGPEFIRTPSLDSAVVHTEKVGGNFAYSTAENHAYSAVAPVVSAAAVPVTNVFAYRQPFVYQPFVHYPTFGFGPSFVVPQSPAVVAANPIASPPIHSGVGTTVDEDSVSVESA